MVLEHQDAVRVLLVDDDPRIRETIPPMVDRWEGHVVVAVLPSADSLISSVVRQRPDIVLLDLDMPGRNPFEAITDLAYRGSHTKVIILSGLDDASLVRQSLSAGARGYILKIDGPAAIHAGIHAVLEGARYLSPGLVDRGLGHLLRTTDPSGN